MSNMSVFVSLGIFLIVQLGTFIWWMSKVTTILGFIRVDLDRSAEETKERDKKRDESEKAMWKRIDEIRDMKATA